MIRLLIPCLLFVFGLIISIYSYNTYNDFDSYGAAFYPCIIGGCVAFFSLIDFGIELNMRKKYIFQSFNSIKDLQIILFISCAIFFYVFCSDYLGFILTVTLILWGLSLPYMKSKRLVTSIFLCVVAVLIYLLFAKVLLVPLPVGEIF